MTDDTDYRAPRTETLTADVAASAAGADAVTPLGDAPFDGVITAVRYIPKTVLTGANTDSRTISVVDKGQGGAGTTVVASKAFTAGVNAPANDETDITLSVVADATDVVEGDVLTALSTHVGSTGLADPGGHIEVDISAGVNE